MGNKATDKNFFLTINRTIKKKGELSLYAIIEAQSRHTKNKLDIEHSPISRNSIKKIVYDDNLYSNSS
ncbi:hypothetical protein C0W40_01225 [Photobacterium leiognathi subsp. mandapamensis]|nr:hypothetical protein C0W40_01225 [Photobacterium leiognathi subsp. mandapamensis]